MCAAGRPTATATAPDRTALVQRAKRRISQTPVWCSRSRVAETGVRQQGWGVVAVERGRDPHADGSSRRAADAVLGPAGERRRPGAAVCGQARMGPLRPGRKAQRHRQRQAWRPASTSEVPAEAWMAILVPGWVAASRLEVINHRSRSISIACAPAATRCVRPPTRPAHLSAVPACRTWLGQHCPSGPGSANDVAKAC